MRNLLTAVADRLLLRLDHVHITSARKLAICAYIFGYVDALITIAIVAVVFWVAK